MTTPATDRPDDWFRVEISDRDGQIVAIESEMLAGRDIGEKERATIYRAIEHLIGFSGYGKQQDDPFLPD